MGHRQGEMPRLHRSLMWPIYGTALISGNCASFCCREGGLKMKTAIIAVSAAALIAAAPAVPAQGVPSKTPGLQNKVSKKHHASVSGHAPLYEMQAKDSNKGSKNGALGYVPDDRSGFLESVRRGGGG